MNQEGQTCLGVGGGGGGCSGNNFIGHKGQILSLKLDLKLIADVGLVGFPNGNILVLFSFDKNLIKFYLSW